MNKNAAKKGGTAKRLLSYVLKGYKFRFFLVLVCILVSAAASVSASLFLGSLIDDYIAPLLLTDQPVFSGLLHTLILMGCLYLAGALCTLAYNRIMVTISQGVQKEIRDELFVHMQTLPIRYFDTHAHGDVMSVYTNDVDTLRQMFSQSIPQMFASLVTIVVVFLAMLVTNPLLTAVVVLCVCGMLLVTRSIAGRSGKYFMRQQEKLGDLNGYIEEMVNGQKVVKVFCHEQKAQEGFDRVNDALFESADMANKYANILMPIMVNIGNIQYVIVAMAGGLMALGGVGGGVTLGVIASFLQLSKSFSQPISQISQQLNSVVMALAGAGRIFALMDEESERDEGTVTLVNAAYDQAGELGESGQRTNLWAWKVPQKEGGFAYTRLTGDVRFFDVDFEYEAGKPILHDISLFAKPGQKLAFVGATGAGKTTITNLINRFYDIADGKIRYDGININKIRKSDLRRSLGIVLQETNLFTGTVRENIRYGNLQATDEEVEAAAQLAGADDFIRRLPQGYDTLLTGNGANLSQGQRQLLAIARCAVADPPVMILDEATSSIDTRTESIVQQGMDSLMCGRTVFVIAHRLSTVRNSDAIMVLDHGRIVERGGHDDLIAQHGLYYQLYTGAFELE
ncbi:ABC transporter ATP-binding protein/permease [Flavonifractor sp. DFI.6.63]|uniref:ABC transporter ATP-binding protein n=1 Tax=Lawsonibacter hominis TaxID=2763053 RepID=A0A8J6JHH7_9FIRM|nr:MULTISPECIES: ABC transporter ATP-binding protein [Oscillospiraceae]MBS1383631.1 ABC transporter ATP-binding protein [Flavonifractor sp.]MDU2196459.1 ABC transporter ATP-binding protein [Clostridiales bacterium]MDY2976666.1 ABC transporter ATP-binding protein [Oscillospiraceae bacterium]MBC5734905.1 ABC transporter ATP-binding protein [Lawsonibacter hominis]MCI6398831.1 ABC transporter ATP-binding protein/permease [Lawsonibacter sp.]